MILLSIAMEYFNSQPDHIFARKNISFEEFQHQNYDHALTNLLYRNFDKSLKI